MADSNEANYVRIALTLLQRFVCGMKNAVTSREIGHFSLKISLEEIKSLALPKNPESTRKANK